MWQCRFNQHTRRRSLRAGVAKIWLRRALAFASPIVEIFLHQIGKHGWLHIASHDDNGVFGAIPAVMKGAEADGICRLQRFGCPNGGPVGKALPLKRMLTQRIAIDHLRAAILAQFGQNNRALGIQRGWRNAWIADHA